MLSNIEFFSAKGVLQNVPNQDFDNVVLVKTNIIPGLMRISLLELKCSSSLHIHTHTHMLTCSHAHMLTHTHTSTCTHPLSL